MISPYGPSYKSQTVQSDGSIYTPSITGDLPPSDSVISSCLVLYIFPTLFSLATLVVFFPPEPLNFFIIADGTFVQGYNSEANRRYELVLLAEVFSMERDVERVDTLY